MADTPLADGQVPDFAYLRSLPDGSLTQAEVRWLCDEIGRLRRLLNEAQERSIEARNPGIDMEEVRRVRGA